MGLDQLEKKDLKKILSIPGTVQKMTGVAEAWHYEMMVVTVPQNCLLLLKPHLLQNKNIYI